jgi:guanosine-3',5'-bis(diphosphate) 3'-pyrophosphohydrolase
MATRERAIVLAVRAHESQVDKAGAPYVLHPLRMKRAASTAEARTAAVLHDVVERPDVTLDGLPADGLPEVVIGTNDALTKRPGGERRLRRVHPTDRAKPARE